MFKLKRSAISLLPIALAAVVAVVAMSTTAPGAAALRTIAGKLALNAQAAGGGGGGGGGVDSIAIPSATLTAKLAVTATVTNVQVIACPNTFVASGFPPPCDFGSSIGTIISIK